MGVWKETAFPSPVAFPPALYGASLPLRGPLGELQLYAKLIFLAGDDISSHAELQFGRLSLASSTCDFG